MARFHRPSIILQEFTVAAGATDQDNLVDRVVPSPSATLLQASFTKVGFIDLC